VLKNTNRITVNIGFWQLRDKRPKYFFVTLEAFQIMKRKGVEVEIFHQQRMYDDAIADIIEIAEKEGAKFTSKTLKQADVYKKNIKGTSFYKANEKWAERLKKENYTILDFGNRGTKDQSIFYDMERSILFGESHRMKAWE